MMIELRTISKHFTQDAALRDVSLSIKRGEVVSIIGASGSGKSTLLRCINQLEKIDQGQIMLEGIPVIGYDESGKRLTIPRQVVKEKLSKIGMVFQQFNLFPHMTVLGNIMEAPRALKKMSSQEATAWALELLARVNLLDKSNAYPGQLSGGQAQRVAIVRTLALKPRIMLFDEPTSSLDPELTAEVLSYIKQLATERQMTMLIATHEIGFAQEVSDRIVFMDEGTIAALVEPENLFKPTANIELTKFLSRVYRQTIWNGQLARAG
jgi:polar amino acid transport system ATP-binding protein